MQLQHAQNSRHQGSFILFLTLALGLICAFSNTAEAYTITKIGVEDSEDFVVEPGKTELFLNPGETVTRNISVTNRTNRELNFSVGVENFVGSNSPDSTVVLLPAGVNTPYPLSEYVSSEVQDFTLQFGEKITFAVTITTPADMEPGGHYGAIIVSNESPGMLDGNGNEVVGGTRLTSRIGSLILMRVNGDVDESGMLETFKISGPNKLFRQKMPTSFEISFKNDGSVHLVPYGTITITNIFGSEVAQIPVDAYFALPDATRYQEIVWQGKPFSFGLYKAKLEQYRGYGNELDTESIRFAVLPLAVVLPALGGLILVFGILYFVTRRFEIRRK